ncbi:MAG: YfbR-like 5'-deoxynucleotidase [bacterium]
MELFELYNHGMRNDKSLFDHILNRGLAHVVRFNSNPQHFSESVAEHSFYVTYFTTIIVHLLESIEENIDSERAMMIALIHDMEEMFSGDILTPFKHHNKHVSEAIKKVNEEMIPEAFDGLPDALKQKFVTLWMEDARQETKEACVVKIADKLALISKCYEEIKAGNTFFEPIYKKELEKLYTREEVWWQRIKHEILPIVSEKSA